MTSTKLENNLYFPANSGFLNSERSKEIVGLTSKILFLKTAPKAQGLGCLLNKTFLHFNLQKLRDLPIQLYTLTSACGPATASHTWVYWPLVAMWSHAAAAH